ADVASTETATKKSKLKNQRNAAQRTNIELSSLSGFGKLLNPVGLQRPFMEVHSQTELLSSRRSGIRRVRNSQNTTAFRCDVPTLLRTPSECERMSACPRASWKERHKGWPSSAHLFPADPRRERQRSCR